MNTTMKILGLALIALYMTACAQGGSDSKPSASTNGGVGTVPGFDTNTAITGTQSQSGPLCLSPAGAVTAGGNVVPSQLISNRTIWVKVKLTINANTTFTEVVESTDCTITTTGKVVFNSTAKTATFTNQHMVTNTGGVCTIPYKFDPTVGHSYYNYDISFTSIPSNSNPVDKTLAYVKFPSTSAGFAGGLGFRDTRMTYTGDNNSTCYMLYL